MIGRRAMLAALPLLPSAALAQARDGGRPVRVEIDVRPQLPERPGPLWALAAVLASCWAARGHRFTQAQIVERIGPAGGKAGWQAWAAALAGGARDADGNELETRLRPVLEPGQPGGLAPVARAAGIARLIGLLDERQPLALIDRRGDAWLLVGVRITAGASDNPTLLARRPRDGQGRGFALREVAAAPEAIAGPPTIAI